MLLRQGREWQGHTAAWGFGGLMAMCLMMCCGWLCDLLKAGWEDNRYLWNTPRDGYLCM